jgi:hypothetical protein
MKVLLDFHHHDLWESMELLATRLGWTLYRPIGLDWFEQGYWNHERKWHGDAIAKQYLEPWGSDWFVPNVATGGDLWGYRDDPSHPGRKYKLVTLAMAREMHFDIVISSLAHNHEGFARFAAEAHATFGLQIGNVRFGAQDMAEDRWDLAAFGLVSGLMPVTPPKPHVVYHQEFDAHDFRHAVPVREGPLRIRSFVQCYPQDTPAYQYWQHTAALAPEYDWKVFGAYGEAPPDEYQAGNLDRCYLVGEEMRASDIGWHAKRWSDGFGHVIHQWFSVGRPVIGFRDYYKDQLAGALWVEGETAFDLGSRTPGEVVDLLRRFDEEPDYHRIVSQNAARRFREVVDYDAEAADIRRMLESVL